MASTNQLPKKSKKALTLPLQALVAAVFARVAEAAAALLTSTSPLSLREWTTKKKPT
jgi:hypothetical protein